VDGACALGGPRQVPAATAMAATPAVAEVADAPGDEDQEPTPYQQAAGLAVAHDGVGRRRWHPVEHGTL